MIVTGEGDQDRSSHHDTGQGRCEAGILPDGGVRRRAPACLPSKHPTVPLTFYYLPSIEERSLYLEGVSRWPPRAMHHRHAGPPVSAVLHRTFRLSRQEALLGRHSSTPLLTAATRLCTCSICPTPRQGRFHLPRLQ